LGLTLIFLEDQRLSPTDEERRAAYQQLFKHAISATNISEIREAANKPGCWGCGVQAAYSKKIKETGGGR
jgi:hypothetical protein